MKTVPNLGSITISPALPSDAGGGEGGTTNYNLLSNKPKINGVTLQGNLTSEDLNISGGNPEYTNLDLSTVTVGGLKAGSTFENKTIQEMFDDMLYEEKFPTLTTPSNKFTFNGPILVEVGVSINGTFTSSFNRGSINPPYETNGFRSGLPNNYNYTGDTLPSNIPSTSLSNTVSLTDYIFSVPGVKTWTNSVSYDKGEQPVSSSGANFNTPLDAGTTQSISISIEAVYPIYANTQNPNIMTKQPLSNPSEYYQLTVAGEVEGSDKQSIEWWTGIGELKGVQMFSIITNTWEWLGGSKSNSLTGWTLSNINRGEITYHKYTNNVTQVGARQLRFYFV